MSEQIGNASVFILLLVVFLQLQHINQNLRIWLVGVQYLGVFFIIIQVWPLNLAASFLLSGWMGTAVLGMAVIGMSSNTSSLANEQKLNLTNPLISVISGIFILLLSFSLSYSFHEWFSAMRELYIASALLLIGFGAVQVVFYQQILATTAALLTILTGFEILFSGLSSSIFVVGMLDAVTLLIALSGAFWMLRGIIRDNTS